MLLCTLQLLSFPSQLQLWCFQLSMAAGNREMAILFAFKSGRWKSMPSLALVVALLLLLQVYIFQYSCTLLFTQLQFWFKLPSMHITRCNFDKIIYAYYSYCGLLVSFSSQVSTLASSLGGDPFDVNDRLLSKLTSGWVFLDTSDFPVSRIVGIVCDYMKFSSMCLEFLFFLIFLGQW